MRIEIGAIEETAIDRMSVSSSIVFEGRLSEICGERTVGYPSRGLFELHLEKCTFSISFSCSSSPIS